jgi:hypothetical protein
MSAAADRMTDGDIYRLVNDYIGAEQPGHIGDFTYRTLAEFYPHYCGLMVDVAGLRGSGLTMRQIYLQVLAEADRRDQARVIRGTLKKYPPAEDASLGTRRTQLVAEFERLASRLESGTSVQGETLSIQSAVVERAINDASTLLRTTGATSGVDRLHTALHGYLMAICRDGRIEFEDRATLNQLLRRILTDHPALQIEHPRAVDVKTILRTMGSILDSLNPIRNQASVAHPNEHLLGEDEAVLVVDAARTLLNYINRKLAVH